METTSGASGQLLLGQSSRHGFGPSSGVCNCLLACAAPVPQPTPSTKPSVASWANERAIPMDVLPTDGTEVTIAIEDICVTSNTDWLIMSRCEDDDDCPDRQSAELNVRASVSKYIRGTSATDTFMFLHKRRRLTWSAEQSSPPTQSWSSLHQWQKDSSHQGHKFKHIQCPFSLHRAASQQLVPLLFQSLLLDFFWCVNIRIYTCDHLS